ncbi:putative lrr receptor protein kinase [Tripterygium wilfordii]|uniref:Putative lrr receptor protein kinase n=1 Tax=Tripterygium wilfordii TaxID=458696 RepID=A0A7J7CZ51_TRIWF|nr:putative lrr receptor protein kinase [Tripterygium wilfordii]
MKFSQALSQTAMEAVLEVILVFFLIQCALGQEVPLNSSVERSALLDLRSSLGLRTVNWPIKGDPCTNWTGVHCQNGRVVGINISGLKRTRLGRMNPRFSVDSLANLTLLQSFNVSGFLLPGSIPDWFNYRLSSLQVLDLRSCLVSGPVPVSLGNMSRLNELYLSDNNLTGNVPATLGQLMEIAVLDLSRNSLTGSVPSSLSLLGNISRLDLSSNYLSGPVPIELGSISGLQFLNLSDNSLIGSIPVQLGELSRLIELDFSRNSLEGPLPDAVLYTLVQLQILLLSGNKLDGAIPGAMWSMPNLHLLDVSGNRFTGVLSNFSLNSNITGAYAVFNLSNNLLYGTLPTSILGNFSLIDLSSNYLQGKVLDNSRNNITLHRNCLQVVRNQRSLEDCSLFYAERGLSFDNFGAQQPTQTPVPPPEPKKRRQWIYILVGLLGGLGFIVVLALLMVLVLRKCNKGRVNQRGTANVGPVPGGNSSLPKDPAILSGLGESFTYEQLLRATGGFSEINLIKHGHSGDLYRGSLESGIPIVVKKVDLHSFKKESHLLELELFSKVLHSRLVPLMGHNFDHENEKLLVYKYMPHGDLANSLFRVTTSDDDGLQSLDWITRLKIAIGAAEGLSCLHHECNPPLVHRDVQASSILLDDKFEVRLGSLSEVRAQEGDSHQSLLTRYLRKRQPSEPGPSGTYNSLSCELGFLHWFS